MSLQKVGRNKEAFTKRHYHILNLETYWKKWFFQSPAKIVNKIVLNHSHYIYLSRKLFIIILRFWLLF